MTDEHRDEPDADPPEAVAADADGLKAAPGDADTPGVNDDTGGQPRMTWSSVTDSGGSPAPTDTDERPSEASSGFSFDLGGALARLAGDDAPESPAPTPAPTDLPDARTEPDAPAGVEVPAVEAPAVEVSADDSVEDQSIAAASAAAASATGQTFETEAPAYDEFPSTEAPAPTASTAPASAPLFESEPADEPTPADESTPADSAPAGAVAATTAALAWESVIDHDEAPAADPLPTRGAPEPPTETAPPEYPRRTPGTHMPPEMRADEPPPATTITPSVDPTPAEASRPAASVFGDDAPTLPGNSPATSSNSQGAVVPPGPNALPSLPASNPAAPPPVVEPVSTAPATPDITALRSAQLRQSKQQRQGKLFGRTLLAFVVIGGLVAAALVFGRSLLFSTEWDAELTPVVNEVEAARGAEFAETVPLEVVSAEAFGERLRAATIGDDWVDQVPQWRALGLATGSVTAESVGASLAASTVALYDAEADTIYLVDGADEEQASADLRVALEAAYDQQIGADPASAFVPAEQPQFTGVSTLESIANRAVDQTISTGGSAVERQAADESLPVPISYELAAVDSLGEAIIAASGVEPSSLTVGGERPDTIGQVLDDTPTATSSGLLLPGEVSLAPPTALGTDDWSLAWGGYLGETEVARLVGQVTADSYRAVERDGVTCFRAVFVTANAAAGTSVLSSMQSWAAAAPPASQATATQLSETRIQLEACDPGAESGVTLNEGVTDALITRQIARLTN